MLELVTCLAEAPLRMTAKPRRPIISASVATIGWTRPNATRLPPISARHRAADERDRRWPATAP